MGVAQSNKLRERDRAIARPITGDYPELARQVRRLLGWDAEIDQHRFVTAKDAERQTDVNATTITKMADGHRPKADTIVKFATALRAEPSPILIGAGYIAGFTTVPIDVRDIKFLPIESLHGSFATYVDFVDLASASGSDISQMFQDLSKVFINERTVESFLNRDMGNDPDFLKFLWSTRLSRNDIVNILRKLCNALADPIDV